MRRRRFLIALVLCCGLAAPARAETPPAPGARTITAPSPDRGAAIDFTAWYPTPGGGTPAAIGGGKVIAGTPSLRDAPVAEGTHPVVLIAAGGLRSAPYGAGWIAAALASRGFIAVLLRPPSFDDADAAAALREIWLRPADLSAALDAVLRDPVLAPHAAPDRVAAVGFFLGGTAALALGGARLDPDAFRHSCDSPGGGPDCEWFARNGVDLHTADPAPLARTHRDPRIRAIIAVDPELGSSIAPSSLAAISIPVDIVTLGAAATLPPGLDPAALIAAMPRARHDTIVDATPFSAFNLCTPRGAAILRAAGEDAALCDDTGGATRAEIHRRLGDIIAAALARDLAP